MIQNNGEGHGYITLWLADCHTEYPLPTRNCQVIFDPWDIEELFGEATRSELCKRLPQELQDIYEEPYIWQVSGKIDHIKNIFREYVVELMKGPQGADDDTYDYWPSAMSVCWQMAQDLDKLTDSKDWTEHLKSEYEKSGLEVDEFEPDWKE